MTTRTLTALFIDHSTAEIAAERLRAVGIPEESIEMHRASEGDIPPGDVPSGGLFGLADLFVPDADRAGYASGVEGGGTLLVALRVPEALVDAAVEALEEDSAEVDTERDPEPSGEAGRRRVGVWGRE
jgi:hypothetical protein